MANDRSKEEVLVVPADRLTAAGEFHGFRPADESFRRMLLDPAFLAYRPRAEVETDPSYKQLIPYVVIRCGAEVFHYTRGATGTETRLQALRSVGLGGHIAREDGAPAADPYRAGMQRELNEEVEIRGRRTEQPFGFIYDARTPVGQVHIGIVHLIDVEEPLVWPREAAIDEAGFAPLRDLLRHRDEFERWSQFVLEELARK